MKNINKYFITLLVSIIGVTGISAQTLPDLGSAKQFVLLANNSSNVNDYIKCYGKAAGTYSGLSNLNATGGVYPITDPAAQAAIVDLHNIINYCISNSFTSLTTLNHQRLTPGFYEINSNTTLSDTIILDGDSTSKFVFKINGSLVASGGALVLLGNTKPENVVWVITASAAPVTLNEDVSFSGILISQGNITLQSRNSGYLSALTVNGNITINNTDPNDFDYLYCYSEMQKMFSNYPSIIPCFSDELRRREALNNPMLQKNILENESIMKEYADYLRGGPGPVNNFVIPVVVHIVHSAADVTPGMGSNISDAQVLNQIQALNDNFANTTVPPGASPPAVNTHIRFCLATRRPNGSSFNGIDRTPDALTNVIIPAQEAALKTINNMSSDRYLNIWVVSSITDPMVSWGTILGVGTFPLGNPMLDGIMIRYDRFGDIVTASCVGCNLVATSEGKVLVHEAGHYLDLYHTFQGSCTGSMTIVDCSTGGDKCCDTPPVSANNFFCPVVNTCHENYFGGCPLGDCNDQVENHMDYTSESCQSAFTSDQMTRMHSTLLTSRAFLVSAGNLAFTQIQCLGGLTADFGFDPSQICEGATINFNAIYASATATYDWDFGDGNTFSATGNQNASNIYLNAGSYSVTLTVTDGTNSLTNIQYQIIYVVACNGIICSQNNWYFGLNASVNFSSGMPVAPSAAPYSQMSAPEAAITQSDATGNLLFYSDGQTIWNNIGTVVTSGLLGDPSSTQALCIPVPQSTTDYYIIYEGGFSPNCHFTRVRVIGFVVTVIQLNMPINVPGPITEAMTAVPNCSGNYWVIFHNIVNNPVNSRYYVCLATNTGIVFNQSYISQEVNNSYGISLKASPDGRMIAIAAHALAIGAAGGEVCHFDPTTGAISNTQILVDPSGVNIAGYGVSFSRNAVVNTSGFLYVTADFNGQWGLKNIIQYDVQNNFNPAIITTTAGPWRNLQLGPDDKIYVANGLYPGPPPRRLGVINYPDVLNTSISLNQCGFNPLGIFLDPTNLLHTSYWSLPNFVDVNACNSTPPYQPDFTYTLSNCSTFTFTATPCGTVFSWDFGDSFTATGNPVTHTYTTAPFSFVVTLTVDANPPVSHTVTIANIQPPVINGPTCVTDLSLSYSYTTVLVPGLTYTWVVTNGSQVSSNPNGIDIVWSSLPGTVTVTATNANGCSATNTLTVLSCGDLTIEKTVDHTFAYAGQIITYNITIHNYTNTAQTVTLSDLIDPNFVVTGNSCSLDLSGGNTTLPPINPNSTVVCTITGYYTHIGTYINCVTMTDQLMQTYQSCSDPTVIAVGCPMVVCTDVTDCIVGSPVQLCLCLHNLRSGVDHIHFDLVYPNYLSALSSSNISYHLVIQPFVSSVSVGPVLAYSATHNHQVVDIYFSSPVDLGPVPFGPYVSPICCFSVNIVTQPSTNIDYSWVDGYYTILDPLPTPLSPAYTQAGIITFPDPSGTCFPQLAPPDASFTLTHNPCSFTIQVVANVSGPDIINRWEWGDNATTPVFGADSYTYTYSQPGTYIITHTIIINNVASTQTQTVVIDPSCCSKMASLIIPDHTYASTLSPFVTGIQVDVQGEFIIDQTFAFVNCLVKMEPGSKIIVRAPYTFYINSSTLEACSYMWRGIFVESGANCTAFLSNINDAQYAMYAYDGSTIGAYQSTFDRDYVGIEVPQNPNPPYYNTIGHWIEQCIFNCTSPLHAPFTGQSPTPGAISFAGVEGNSVVMDFYNPNPVPNKFLNLSNGIVGWGMNMHVKNCYFENINPDPTYLDHFNGSAIYDQGYGKGFNFINQTGFGHAPNITSFLKCHYGIFGDVVNVYSDENVMLSMDYGYKINYANKLNIDILDNWIENKWTSIDLFFNDNSNHLLVEANKIFFGDMLSQAHPTGDAAINVQEMHGANPDSKIRNNVIQFNHNKPSAWYGIALHSAASYQVTYNTVLMDNNKNNIYGIMTSDCDKPIVSCNTVNGDHVNFNANDRQAAIYNFKGQFPTIACNTVDGTVNGIYFSGPVGNGADLKGNNIYYHKYGLFLDNSAIIGTQKFKGNLWYQLPQAGGVGAVYAHPANPFIYPFIIDPTITIAGSNPMPPSVSPPGWFISQHGQNFLCNDNNHDVAAYCDQFSYKGKRLASDDQELTTYIYPNPATEKATLVYHIPENTSGELILYDMLGQVAYRHALDDKQTSFEFDIANLAPAMYYFNVRANGESFAQGRLSIIH